MIQIWYLESIKDHKIHKMQSVIIIGWPDMYYKQYGDFKGTAYIIQSSAAITRFLGSKKSIAL